MIQDIKKKNNFRKSFLVICLVVFLVLISTFLFTLYSDLNLLKNNKLPKFASYTSKEKGANKYIGFGYRVFYSPNGFYAITYLWAGQEDVDTGYPFENRFKVIFSGNIN